MSLQTSLLSLALLLALGSRAAAQSPFLLVGTGDDVPGVGLVTHIEAVMVDGTGWWLVQAATDNPAVPSVVFREGLVWSQVGEPVPGLTGATVAAFGGWSEDLFGGTARKVRLAGTPGGSTDDVALMWEHAVHLQTGTPTDWSTPQFPPGTVWSSFGEARYGQHSADFALTGTVADPTQPGSERTFLALAGQYGSWGVCCSIAVLAEEGRMLPGSAERIRRVRTGPWNARLHPAGARLCWSCEMTGPPGASGCVWSYGTATKKHTLLAREGSPSPVAGRVWGPLNDLSLDVGNTGWTLRSFLDASDPVSDGIVVRNGTKLVQEGDALPDIAPFLLDDLGHGRAILDNTGHVLWYGHWNDPSGPSEALFVDQAVLVRTGTPVAGGSTLTRIGSGPDDYDLALGGNYVVFTGTLADGREGAFALNLGLSKGYCQGKKNSLGCFVHSSITGTPSASAGSGFLLQANAILSQVRGQLFYGTTGPAALPLLDAILCVRPPLRRLPPIGSGGSLPQASACDGALTEDFNAWIASGADPALVPGTTVFAQFWARDPGFPAPTDFVLSQAFEFTIGP